jgi:hypothetical protein
MKVNRRYCRGAASRDLIWRLQMKACCPQLDDRPLALTGSMMSRVDGMDECSRAWPPSSVRGQRQLDRPISKSHPDMNLRAQSVLPKSTTAACATLLNELRLARLRLGYTIASTCPQAAWRSIIQCVENRPNVNPPGVTAAVG